jgi:hypothetical protein
VRELLEGAKGRSRCEDRREGTWSYLSPCQDDDGGLHRNRVRSTTEARTNRCLHLSEKEDNNFFIEGKKEDNRHELAIVSFGHVGLKCGPDLPQNGLNLVNRAINVFCHKQAPKMVNVSPSAKMVVIRLSHI